MRVTLEHVAKRAGCTAATVSMVLNGRNVGRISEDTVSRVRSAAAELGYTPNRVARALARQQTQTVGLLSIGVTTEPSPGEMLNAARVTAAEHGYVTLVIESEATPEALEDAWREFQSHQVAGVIVATYKNMELEIPAIFDTRTVVLVDCTDVHGEFDSIVPNEFAAAEFAVRSLVELGHKRIGFAHVSQPGVAAEQRAAAVRHFMHTLDDSYSLVEYQTESSRTVDGFEAGMALLSGPDRPTGIFAFSDRMAMGVYQAAQELGIRIPSQLSVFGFDDQRDLASALRPALTTMSLPFHEMGAWGMTRLLRHLSQEGTGQPVHVLAECPAVQRVSLAQPEHQ